MSGQHAENARTLAVMSKPTMADWDGQTRRWHDKHWFHEDADGKAVREYNTLTERMPWWAIAAVIVAGGLAMLALSIWQSRA